MRRRRGWGGWRGGCLAEWRMDEMHVALVMEVLVGFGFVACLGRGDFGCGLVWKGTTHALDSSHC
jgi:hypothetical protein